MTRILFVCHGNICRSPMAEFVMKELARRRGLQVEVASAGTSMEEYGNPVHPGTLRVLSREGIPSESRRARRVRPSDYEAYDFIIGMDKPNMYVLNELYDDRRHKVRMLLSFCGEDRSVADPWYTGDFDATYRDVLRGCTALCDMLEGEKPNG